MKILRLPGIVALAALIICTPAFSSGTKEAVAQKEKLVFMFPYDAESSITQWHQKNVELFKQAYPGADIEVISSVTGDSYLTQVTTMMASGDKIDVLQGWTLARMEPFATSGKLLNLKPAIDADPAFKDFLQKPPLEATTFSGGIYGIPLESAVELVFYNKEIFTKAGVDVPLTYEDFLDTIAKIKKAGYIPIALGNSEPWIGTIPYMMLLDRIGGLDAYQKTVVKGTGSWTDPPFIEAAKELQRWIAMGAFEPNVNGIPAVEGIARFQNGEAAMCFMGSWSLPAFYNSLRGKLGVFNLPSIKGGKGSVDNWIIIPNQSISIASNTKNQKLAVDFLKFMFSSERQKELAIAGLMVTTNVKLDPVDVNPVLVDIHRQMASSVGAIYPWDVALGASLGQELNNATRNFYDGADPEKVLATLQEIVKNERKK